MQSDVNITTGQITVNCVEGYLLVPEDGSVLECNGMIGEWIIPDCEGTYIQCCLHRLSRTLRMNLV